MAKTKRMSWIVGACALMLLASGAQAATVNSLTESVWQGSDVPVIYEDTNYSLAEQTVVIGQDANGANITVNVITGFVDFTSVANTGASIPPSLIKELGTFVPTESFDVAGIELTGWFAAYIVGVGSDPEGSASGAVFLAPLPAGVTLSIGGTNRTWNPSSTGTLLQLWEDAANDFDPTTQNDAWLTTTDGTWTADIGFLGTPSTSATYAAGDEYFVNLFDSGDLDANGVPVSGANPKRILGSVNFLGTAATSIFSAALPNDTGNTFYAEGDFTGANQGVWRLIGDLDAKVLIAPLPGAAWAGFALLGLLGVGRRIRRRNV